jgi:hypothetical protein
MGGLNYKRDTIETSDIKVPPEWKASMIQNTIVLRNTMVGGGTQARSQHEHPKLLCYSFPDRIP